MDTGGTGYQDYRNPSRRVSALLRSLPFAWAVSRINVSESVKVRIVPADEP